MGDVDWEVVIRDTGRLTKQFREVSFPVLESRFRTATLDESTARSVLACDVIDKAPTLLVFCSDLPFPLPTVSS